MFFFWGSLYPIHGSDLYFAFILFAWMADCRELVGPVGVRVLGTHLEHGAPLHLNFFSVSSAVEGKFVQSEMSGFCG